MTFDEAFVALLGNEGGYVNNSADPGGATNWGITARVAIANGYIGDMRYLSQDTAKGIYKKLYWDAVRGDELPPALVFHVFDAAVNSGPAQAIKWLQQAVGTVPDGVLGAITLAATQRADVGRLVAAFSAGRLDFMTNLPTWAAFGKGWARRIAGNLKLLGAA